MRATTDQLIDLRLTQMGYKSADNMIPIVNRRMRRAKKAQQRRQAAKSNGGNLNG